MRDVLKEVDKRIRRLEAEIELAENRLEFLNKIGASSKYKLLEKNQGISEIYIAFFMLWGFIGLVLLLYLKYRYGEMLPFSLTPYIILMVFFILLPVVYYVLPSRKSEEETPIDYLIKRERMARLLINRFYKPLRDALEKDDKDRLKGLADEISMGELARAAEELNEGNPKVMAYALYLYAARDSASQEEIQEALTLIKNKPLKLLLSTLLKESPNSEQ
ncbi:hypothetical protein NF865_08935 [Thermococcus aggregans]|uniref:Uncharacterized protein n=1 Tax=Thermococcus aggregans TaxID=110163 RepID=A0A9E7SNK5_THEAG|nr:hypothetical protein [Thermococcus aggregans]USS40420.1 hypothetical protein NF865_08935 [Thermococcus aggregans]